MLRLCNEIYFNEFWDWKNCWGAPIFQRWVHILTGLNCHVGMERLFIWSSKAFFETALQAESPVMINRFKCECPGYTVSQRDECTKVCLRLHVCLLRQSQRRHLPNYLTVPKQRKTKGPRSLNLHPHERRKPTDGTAKCFYIQQRCYISDTNALTV